MKKLKDLIRNISIEKVVGTLEVWVAAIAFDSREVSEKALFIATEGTLTDGHQYISKAISQGAKVVVCKNLPLGIQAEVTYIQTKETTKALAFIAAAFYNNPSKELQLVGVTGTNGKTTVATLLHQLFTLAGYKVGLLSTVAIKIGDEVFSATHTTPDAIRINQYLRVMVEAGCSYCFMEVSSHGIDQKRTEALLFAGGIFTNLTHDHLDYHQTFAIYRDVKKSFFDALPKSAFAITNLDDKNGRLMLQNTKAKQISYGVKTLADVHANVLESQFGGMLLRINNKEVWVRLIGSFNVSNVLAVYAAALQLGLKEQETLVYLSQLQSVSGRFQFVISPNKITAIVDYAHTPDALDNVLLTINQIKKSNQRVITVVGCGGNRDKEKRPKMAKIAFEGSSQVILTSDNPRFENPKEILQDMQSGLSQEDASKYLIIEDREQAIKTATIFAKSGDIILIAGKGHETYQEIEGVKHHFNDLEKLQQYLTK